jgi:hypothetical protein
MNELQDLIRLAELTAAGLEDIERMFSRMRIRLLAGVAISYGAFFAGVSLVLKSGFAGADLLGRPWTQITGGFFVVMGLLTLVTVVAGGSKLAKLRVEKRVELHVYQDVESLIEEQQRRFSPDELSPIARATISIRLRRIGRSRYSS